MSIFLSGFFLVYLATAIAADDLLVHTAAGSLRGSYKISSHGRRYRAFEGIPYAKPPVDDLRFEPPQPYGFWEGILEATNPKSICIQWLRSGRVLGDEDCLSLNIHVPLPNQTTTESQLLPVLFWIHGGAFQMMWGHSQGPSYIMNRDMIYVTFNYRLGILGFMSTEDEGVPGNMGLKDQSLALRWIHDNIKSFGGDPARITVAGGSAGATSAHYHYLSPLSRGLFQGGMSFSGTALNCWGQTEGSAEKAKKVGSLQGCPTNDIQAMVKCLKSRPAASIVKLTSKFQPWRSNPATPFGPVVEKNSSNPFIDRSPVEIITSRGAAQVPWIASVVSEEGLFPVGDFLEKEEAMAELDEKWEELAPHLLDFNFTLPQSRHAQVAAAIRRHYLGSARFDNASAKALIQMFGDRLFVADAGRAAELMAKNTDSSVRFYYYSYRNTFSLADLFNVTGNYGVSHGDDVDLFIANPGLPTVTDEPTLSVQNSLLDIIESFVTRGIPPTDIDWPTVDPSQGDFKYLQILGPRQFRAGTSSNFADQKFWSSIDFNENKEER